MTAPVTTLGPVDTNVGVRAKLYAVLSLLGVLVSGAQTFGLLNAGQAENVGSIVTGVSGLLLSGGLALASHKATQQKANGTFDAAPPPPPAVVAVDGIKAMVDQVNTLNDAVVEGVQRMQDIAGVLPALRSLTQLGPLAQQVLDQGRGGS